MAKWRLRSMTKPTGGSLKRNSKKVRHQRSREFAETRVGETRIKPAGRRGGNERVILLAANKANVLDTKTGKTFVTKIMLVSSNPANPHYTRRNILTRGAIIKTEKGMAKVTNRPSREGIVNAVLETK